MIIAILLMVGLTHMEEHSAMVISAILLIIASGLIVPIWMLIRSVQFLSKKQLPGAAPIRTVAILLTGLLGLILLVLFMAVILYVREDRQPPF